MICTQTYIQVIFSAATPRTVAVGLILAAMVAIPVGLPCAVMGIYMQKNGAKVLRQTLDLTAPQTEINKQDANMIVSDCHTYYILYNGGSHRSTWQHAYDLQPATEWIFAQHN